MTAPDESNKQQHFGIVPKELMQATPVLLPLLLSIMQSSAKQRAKYELKCRAVRLSCYHFCLTKTVPSLTKWTFSVDPFPGALSKGIQKQCLEQVVLNPLIISELKNWVLIKQMKATSTVSTSWYEVSHQQNQSLPDLCMTQKSKTMIFAWFWKWFSHPYLNKSFLFRPERDKIKT